MSKFEEDDGGKVIIHSDAHKLLFGGNDMDAEIKVKQELNPYNRQHVDNNRKAKAPQIQKPSSQRNQNVGYGEKYSNKKSFPSPLTDKNYSPAPIKDKNKTEYKNPLFQANPLPDLNEEDFKMNKNIVSAMPHEVKKADFEKNRRNQFTNISQHIVSSKDDQTQNMQNLNKITRSSTNISDRGINHSQNTNKGYVKMTAPPQYGGQPLNTGVKVSTGQQYEIENSKLGMAKKQQASKPESILQQYSQKMPPHQIEYESGFQQIPSPKYNMDDFAMHIRAQPRPVIPQQRVDPTMNDYSYYTNEAQPQPSVDESLNNDLKNEFGTDVKVINVPPRPPKPNAKQNKVNKDTYKPYTLKEYKERHADGAQLKMGGLGANIGTDDWVMRNSKLQAMKNFASKVNVENRARSQNPPPRRKEEKKEVSNRKKALEFAKNIPKPKVPEKRKSKVKQSNIEQNDDNYGPDDMMGGLEYEPGEPEYNELDQLNQKHEEYVNEVNNIRKLFM